MTMTAVCWAREASLGRAKRKAPPPRRGPGAFFVTRMDNGEIVLDLQGPQRVGMTVEDLLRAFKAKVARGYDDDRSLLG